MGSEARIPRTSAPWQPMSIYVCCAARLWFNRMVAAPGYKMRKYAAPPNQQCHLHVMNTPAVEIPTALEASPRCCSSPGGVRYEDLYPE